MSNLETHRRWFARLITANAGIPASDHALIEAFATTPRERFVSPGPWKIFTRLGYIETPSDDPALLYQDVTIGLKSEKQINSGQPTLHALCLSAVAMKEGETVLHVGAGAGYYSAILAKLVGPNGSVVAYEIESDLAAQAAENLADVSRVLVRPVSAAEGPLPACDVIYVCAGATDPLDIWLDALRPGGRLLFPLTPNQGAGAILLVSRRADDTFTARFLCGALFIPCVGARDEETEKNLAAAFLRGDMAKVRSLRRGTEPDGTSWCAGRTWWLSTESVD
ncbi:MAG: protein-L-isoaspartate(D-aspartate) O-methyltransferase [Acidobacteriota bacterium]